MKFQIEFKFLLGIIFMPCWLFGMEKAVDFGLGVGALSLVPLGCKLTSAAFDSAASRSAARHEAHNRENVDASRILQLPGDGLEYLTNELTNRPYLHDLTTAKIRIRYALQEAEIFCRRWGLPILGGVGTAALGIYGISKVGEVIATMQTTQDCIGVGTVALLGAVYPACEALQARSIASEKDQQKALSQRFLTQAHNSLRSKNTEHSQLTDKLTRIEKQLGIEKDPDAVAGLFKRVALNTTAIVDSRTKSLLSEKTTTETQLERNKTERTQLSTSVNTRNKEVTTLEQERSNFSNKALRWGIPAAGSTLLGLGCLAYAYNSK